MIVNLFFVLFLTWAFSDFPIQTFYFFHTCLFWQNSWCMHRLLYQPHRCILQKPPKLSWYERNSFSNVSAESVEILKISFSTATLLIWQIQLKKKSRLWLNTHALMSWNEYRFRCHFIATFYSFRQETRLISIPRKNHPKSAPQSKNAVCVFKIIRKLLCFT